MWCLCNFLHILYIKKGTKHSVEPEGFEPSCRIISYNLIFTSLSIAIDGMLFPILIFTTIGEQRVYC